MVNSYPKVTLRHEWTVIFWVLEGNVRVDRSETLDAALDLI